MKLCMNCRRTSPGKPLFCNFCGTSYNIRLCSRQHVNPRAAEVCSQCGSRDLSQPQPKPSLLLRPLLWLLGLSPGLILLAAISVTAFIGLQKLLSDPAGMLWVMLLALGLGILFLLWMSLPNFLKKFIKKLFT